MTHFPLTKLQRNGIDYAAIRYKRITLAELALLHEPECDCDTQRVIFPCAGNEGAITTMIYAEIERKFNKMIEVD